MFDSDTVIVCDLDDTLYNESEYQSSGYNAVIDFITSIYGLDKIKLKQIVSEGGDVLEALSAYIGFPTIKESLLWVYRLHSPKIKLAEDVQVFIDAIRQKKIKFVLLTDGRSLSQRLKIEALGLSDFEVFISEEYNNAIKPAPQRFEVIQDRYLARKFVYVGDNLSKDFLTPNRLNWTTVGIRPRGNAIHKHNVGEFPAEFQPDYWIDNLREMEKFYVEW